MLEVILSVSSIVLGLIVLIWSADKFVEGASATAKHLGVPLLIIGMLVVGFGTSAPEMVVAILAAIEGNPNLALGNAIGSNIANIGLILGLTACMVAIKVDISLIKKELPLLILITLILGFFIFDMNISRMEGILLLVTFIIFIVWQIIQSIMHKNNSAITPPEIADEIEGLALSLKQGIFWLIAGIVLLVGSSKILVWGAVNIANYLGVSDLIIGLTIIAIGTSLPELAASIAAIKKNAHDLVLGNVIGSNMFNILLVIGVGAVIEPMKDLPQEAFDRDYLFMLALTIGLLIISYGFRNKKAKITRPEGALILSLFVIYMGTLIYSSL